MHVCASLCHCFRCLNYCAHLCPFVLLVLHSLHFPNLHEPIRTFASSLSSQHLLHSSCFHSFSPQSLHHHHPPCTVILSAAHLIMPYCFQFLTGCKGLIDVSENLFCECLWPVHLHGNRCWSLFLYFYLLLFWVGADPCALGRRSFWRMWMNNSQDFNLVSCSSSLARQARYHG